MTVQDAIAVSTEAKAVLWELNVALREGDTGLVFRILFELGLHGELDGDQDQDVAS
jgi:hypothetical protein